MAKADAGIHQASKARMKRQVILALAFVALVYFVFLFPRGALQLALGQANLAAEIATRLFGAVTVGPLLSVILFASDSAVKGGGRTGRWVRSLFASSAAKLKFNCTDGDADSLW